MPLLLIMALFVGLFYAASRQMNDVPLLDAYLQQNVGLRGQICREPVLKKGTWQMRLKVEAAKVKDGTWSAVDEQMALVKWRPNEQDKNKGMTPRYGDVVQIDSVRLQAPSPARNPGAFDAKSYYQHQGISYLLTVQGQEQHWQVLAHDEAVSTDS